MKKNREWDEHTESGDYDAQDQDATVRIASIPQEHLRGWRSSRSLKNTVAAEQLHINSPLPQDIEVAISSPVETEIPKTERADARAQRETPIPSELSQSLPTTPVPPIPETWQRVPVTELPVPKPPGSNRLWPAIIILSAVAAGLVNFVFTGIAIRPIIVFWFLFICPGMVVVRFLRLKEHVAEWTLAIALSFAIDAIVAGALLYSGRWSPAVTLIILMGFSLCGAIVQLAPGALVVPKLQYVVRSRKPGVLLPVVLALLVGIIFGASLWSYEVYHGAGSATSTSALPHKATPRPSSASTVIPTPSQTLPLNIARLYHGTILDIQANLTTEMSLMGIQQAQRSISGNFTGLHMTGIFNGVITPSEHIQFLVKDSAGTLILSFDGDMQSDGELSGNYCSVNQQAQCTGEYGLWSVAPAS